MATLGRSPGAAPLTSADIPDNSITAAKIVDATIVAADLAPDSVDSSELVDGSIDTSHIGANQVTAAKVAADVATQAELDAQRTNSSITTLGTVTAGNLSHADIVYPTGHVIQVIETFVGTTSSQSLSTNVVASITGLSRTITCLSGSKVLIFARWNGEASSNPHGHVFGLKRDTTEIGLPSGYGSRSYGIHHGSQGYHGDDNDSTPENVSFQFLDTPGTASEVTYYLTVTCSSAVTLYNQRTVNDGNFAGNERETSSLILMEIAG
jgi:hypothetical protein